MKWNRPLALSMFAIALFALCASDAMSQAALDIIMDGPWIYYDQATLNGVPVLVAMAPYVYGHTGPVFTTGYGDFTPNLKTVYCVAFDTKCAFNTGNQSLQNSVYAALALLPVKVKTLWPTIDPNANAYYFILPMPDSASNDGQESMEFGQTFGSYNSAKAVAIGLVLHYTKATNVASEIELYDCNLDAKCTTKKSVASQINYGTLRLGFTNVEDPSDTLGCDHHIRFGHHKMMEFLGSGNGLTDLNNTYYYVDLRDKNGVYNPNCYADDPQNPANQAFSVHGDQRPVDVTKELGNIVLDLERIGDGGCPRIQNDRSESGLGCETLKKLVETLKGQTPKPSQYGEIERALRASIADISLVTLEQLETERKEKHKPLNEKSSAENQLETMRDAQSKEMKLDDIVIYDSTSGKDCRVGQMLIRP